MKALPVEEGEMSFWRTSLLQSGRLRELAVPASRQEVMEKGTCQNSERSFFRRLQVWLMEIIVLRRRAAGSLQHWCGRRG